MFTKLQPQCVGRDEVVRELEERETDAGQIVEQQVLHSQPGQALTVGITQHGLIITG